MYCMLHEKDIFLPLPHLKNYKVEEKKSSARESVTQVLGEGV